jgi:hypothetical protein
MKSHVLSYIKNLQMMYTIIIFCIFIFYLYFHIYMSFSYNFDIDGFQMVLINI